MSHLDPDHRSHAQKKIASIEGWIDLGNLAEAEAELNRLDPQPTPSIDALKAWVRLHAAKNDWPSVKRVCASLAQQAPDDPFTIQYQAEMLHQGGQSGLALVCLKRGEKNFQGPAKAGYFYTLARYACAIGSLTLASSVLAMAFDLEPALKAKALNDRDLEKVWPDLQES